MAVDVLKRPREQPRPFPGMRSFEPEESDLFFGQESHVSALLKVLGKSRLTAVLGESGCGKSSLVKAGLIARMRRGPGADLWNVIVSRPGRAPIKNLAEELSKSLPGITPTEIVATLGSSSWGLRNFLNGQNLLPGHRVLIIIDQFEELFRFYRQAEAENNALDEADLFVKLLLGVREAPVDPADVPAYIVLTMRSEYLGEAALFFGLAEALNDGMFLLPKMTRAQVEAGIRGPLEKFHATIDNGLLQRLLNETENARQDGLPLLQNALLSIWKKARRGRVKFASGRIPSPKTGQKRRMSGSGFPASRARGKTS